VAFLSKERPLYLPTFNDKTLNFVSSNMICGFLKSKQSLKGIKCLGVPDCSVCTFSILKILFEITSNNNNNNNNNNNKENNNKVDIRNLDLAAKNSSPRWAFPEMPRLNAEKSGHPKSPKS
jgi:hypothetical protein